MHEKGDAKIPAEQTKKNRQEETSKVILQMKCINQGCPNLTFCDQFYLTWNQAIVNCITLIIEHIINVVRHNIIRAKLIIVIIIISV